MNNKGQLYLWGILLLSCVWIGSMAVRPVIAVEEKTESPQVMAANAFPNLNFELPTVIANAGDERLFIAEQAGRIWIVKGEGQEATRTLFLDITDTVQDGCERGLLGLDFHPQFEQNGYFFLNYITSLNSVDHTRISRFQVSADPDRADPQSELILMEIKQYACNHNGGDLHFDPQGMLVTGLGDGGGGGDPENYAQNAQSYLGKLLRIDVDRQENDKNYAIPQDNPFLGQEGVLDEIWAVGLRNPWRFSFDAQNGDLYIGDVGQDSWEEINFVTAAETGGQNFEWSLKEGIKEYKPAQDIGPGLMTGPVHIYAHDNDDLCDSVTGGFVYRGEQMSSLYGTYIYANFCGGAIFGLKRNLDGQWVNTFLVDGESNVVTFGEDYLGELYFVAREKGQIHRLATAHVYFMPITLG